MDKSIISVENLWHKYSSYWVTQNISFQIKNTGVLGLLGSNGAGKSTIMNIICGVLNQTKGKVFINGIDLKENPQKAKREIGFLPQQPPLYKELSVDEHLTHCAFLRQMKAKEVRSVVQETKERCGLSLYGKRLIKNLSGGYQQRVGIAQAIIHKPRLVILDEPTNGLDPNQIVEIRSLIKEIAEDRTVIFSTHILSEVQALCKDVLMIEQGKLVFSDSMEAFNNYIAAKSLQVTMSKPPSKEELLNIEGVVKVEFLTDRNLKIYFEGDYNITNRIVQSSVYNSWDLREIFLNKGSLDEVFAQLSNSSTLNNKA